ncbi:hypothetical protein [Nocardia sp. NPDC004123]
MTSDPVASAVEPTAMRAVNLPLMTSHCSQSLDEPLTFKRVVNTRILPEAPLCRSPVSCAKPSPDRASSSTIAKIDLEPAIRFGNDAPITPSTKTALDAALVATAVPPFRLATRPHPCRGTRADHP